MCMYPILMVLKPIVGRAMLAMLDASQVEALKSVTGVHHTLDSDGQASPSGGGSAILAALGASLDSTKRCRNFATGLIARAPARTEERWWR